ncbi:MAG: hypothetical protein ABGW69_01775 [Nanoarchaeota archaeon]
MNLLYNSLFGVILVIVSIILVIPAIQLILNYKDASVKKQLDSIVKTIEEVKPYEYQKVDINLNNYVLLYNPYHMQEIVNDKPLNFKFWKDYYSYSMNPELDNEKMAIRINDNFQFKYFYSIYDLNYKFDDENLKKAFETLKESLSDFYQSCKSIYTYKDNLLAMAYYGKDCFNGVSSTMSFVIFAYTTSKFLVPKLIKSFETTKSTIKFGYNSILALRTISSLEFDKLTKKEGEKINEKLTKEIVQDVMDNLAKKISEKIIIKLEQKMVSIILIKITKAIASKVATTSFPILGWVFTIISTGYDIYDITKTISKFEEQLDWIRLVTIGYFDNFIEKRINFYSLNDNLLLTFNQNYLILAQKTKSTAMLTETQLTFKEKLNDNIIYVTGATTLYLPDIYENAFDLNNVNSIYVLKLPVEENKYIIFLLNKDEVNKMNGFLELLKSQNIEELSKKYVITLFYDKENDKVKAFVLFKLPLNEEIDNYLKFFTDYLMIYLNWFNNAYDKKELEKIKESVKNHEKSIIYQNLLISTSEDKLDKAIKDSENKFKQCFNDLKPLTSKIVEDNLFYAFKDKNILEEYKEQLKLIALYTLYKYFFFFYINNPTLSCSDYYEKIDDLLENNRIIYYKLFRQKISNINDKNKLKEKLQILLNLALIKSLICDNNQKINSLDDVNFNDNMEEIVKNSLLYCKINGESLNNLFNYSQVLIINRNKINELDPKSLTALEYYLSISNINSLFEEKTLKAKNEDVLTKIVEEISNEIDRLLKLINNKNSEEKNQRLIKALIIAQYLKIKNSIVYDELYRLSNNIKINPENVYYADPITSYSTLFYN